MQGGVRLLRSWGVVFMLVCVAALMAAPAYAKLPRTYQVTRVDDPTPGINDQLGENMVNAGGDIDDDGPDDLVVGIGRNGAIKGRVLVLSGADGSVIREIPAPSDDVDGDTTENEGTAGDPDAPTGFGAAISSIADLGSCPGGEPGVECDTTIVPLSEQNTVDGLPEILVAAVGLDMTTESDDEGAVLVIDGQSGAILKRLRTPAGEATTDVGFGRAILSPGGESACPGKGRGGVGPTPCVYGGSPAVQQGDINDGGRPDIVIGAPDYDDTAATNPACNDGVGGGTCSRSGRVYVFYGEALLGLSPTQYPAAASMTIKNPFAQHDDPALDERYQGEVMGLSLAPVGDLGRCNQSGTPASSCPDAMRSRILDGQPEFSISAPRVDAGPIPDAGVAFVIDGATGVRLDTYDHPEPQAESLFGFSNFNRPALGDVGGNDVLPDVYVPAIGQTSQSLAQGRGYVYSGSNLGNHLISTLNDPTPAKFGNFGTSSAGLGDVARAEVGLDSRKEILIGAFASQDTGGIGDVHVFSPLTDRVLQTIPDPDQQPGSGFGRGLAPMGDTNGDGMIDFAVGAPGFDTSDRGRIYLFTSDDSPLPPAPPPPPPSQQGSGGGGGTPTPTTQVLAGRTLEIQASRTRVRAGTEIRIRGVIEAFTNQVRCERNQTVAIQRRRRGTVLYRTFAEVRSNGGGTFSLKVKPRATYFYRARLSQTANCIGAVSPREQVTVRKRARAARRSG